MAARTSIRTSWNQVPALSLGAPDKLSRYAFEAASVFDLVKRTNGHSSEMKYTILGSFIRYYLGVRVTQLCPDLACFAKAVEHANYIKDSA
jgi:hypothetical protein